MIYISKRKYQGVKIFIAGSDELFNKMQISSPLKPFCDLSLG